MSSNVDLEGFEELSGLLRSMASGDVTRAVRPAMNKTVADILKEAKRQTPRDTGALINSASRRVEVDGRSITGTLGYNTPYAIYVHEENKNYRVGGYRYLARPVEAAGSTVWSDVAQGVEAWLRRQA